VSNRTFAVREMMFGSKEPFEYFECGGCGAIQIVMVPEDLARHYQGEYYSFKNHAREKYSAVEAFLKRARARYAIEGKGLLGKVMAKVQGTWPYFEWFKAAKISFDANILDVGCGRGDYLLRFASDGFTKLTGVDPFVESDLTFENGIRIYRRNLEEMTGEYDCVFSKHSFEHVLDPRKTMGEMVRLTTPGGALLIAVPVAQCWAWQEYGVHWFQLDAPRHIVVPSRKSMELLAREAGLTVEHVLFDSSEAQIIRSELYKRDVSMKEYETKGSRAYFSAAEQERFRKQAAELNATGRGDQACFVMRKGKH
jgi:2-polyprenyl-3-methyl-5-hydroxy-6-metoxy-1,4-benzoquinol methylase